MEEIPFATRYSAETSTLMVFGCVDELSVDAFRRALREATRDYTAGVLVDLNGITFMPSMAIGVLVGAMARAPGTCVEVAEGRPAHLVLKLLGLYDYATTGRRAPGEPSAVRSPSRD